MDSPDIDRLEADVVVVGAGLAGMMAAIEAKRRKPECRVVLLDKGTAGSSGQSVFAAGVFNVFFPDRDDLQEWMQEMILRGEFLNNQDWVLTYLQRNWEVATRIAEIGSKHGKVVFERDASGELVRRQSRGHIKSFHCVFDSLATMQALRMEADELGVEVLNRSMGLRLIVSEARGGVDGVIAMNVRTARLTFLHAPVVVLAAAGSGFKSVFVGHHNITGEMQSEALRAGCDLINMDKTYGNTTSRQHDVHGLNLFVGSGGTFTNGSGEEFMWRYDELGSRARLQDLVIAFSREVNEGRGPIALDMRSVSSADRALMRRVLPETFRTWDAAGVDPFAAPIPWISAYFGTRAAGGGIRVTTDCRTTVPGVLAAGDITDEPIHGTYCFGGVNVAFAAVSGLIAGVTAVEDSGSLPRGSVPDAQLEPHVGAVLAPLGRESSVAPDDVVFALQEVLIREVGFVRDAHSVRQGLSRIEGIRGQAARVHARDPHGLMLAHEAVGMVSLAEAMLASALVREESRGFQFRTDFPYSDNEKWLRWVVCRRSPGGELATATEPVGTPFFRPATARHRPPGMRDDEAAAMGLERARVERVTA